MSTDLTRPHRRRARHHRHDLRVVRQPDRAQAQQARRGQRRRQLRDREGAGHLRRAGHPRRPARHRLGGRVRRGAARPARAARGRRPTRRTRRTPSSPGCSQRLVVSALLTVPVVLLAMVPALQFDAWQWASLTLATPVVVWGAWPFHRAAWTNLRHAATTMDTLVSMGVLAAYAWSLVALFAGSAGEIGMTHAFELTVRARRRSRLDLPRDGHGRHDVPAGRALVRAPVEAPGRRGPARADGPRRARTWRCSRTGSTAPSSPGCPWTGWPWGTSSWCARGRRSPPTAWSSGAPRRWTPRCSPGSRCRSRCGPGDEVTGATVNAGGRLVVRATRVGRDTRLAQMARLVEEAQHGKTEVQRLADRISGVFVPVVIALSVAALGFWLGAGAGATFAFGTAVARPDHRLPVRPRPGDADRPARRHRPRRPARHPDPRPGGPRVHPPRRHRRPRQDRHRHDRRDDPRRRRPCPGRVRRRRTPPGRRGVLRVAASRGGGDSP